MVHRIGPTPQVSQPTGNSPEDVRALSRQFIIDSIDLRARLRDMFPKDGSEKMEAPLPLFHSTTANLPAASLWEGALIYDTDRNRPLYSDGTTWIGVAGGPPVTIASGNATGTNITLTNIPQDFSALHLQLNSISSDTATRHLQIQASIDNGSTWMTTASDYVGFTVSDVAALTYINEASFVLAADVAAANAGIVGLTFHGYANSGHVTAIGRISNGTTNYAVNSTLAKFSPMNGLRVIWNGSGNFDSGTYSLTGIF